jgi:hypothetical protein
MYGYYGAGYDLGDYEGDDLGDYEGVMDILKKEVVGVPVWGLLLGGAALLAFTKQGKSLFGGLMGGKAKKNPKRRRSRKARRNNVSMKMNRRRRSRRSRR